jgi:hypothetical protein
MTLDSEPKSNIDIFNPNTFEKLKKELGITAPFILTKDEEEENGTPGGFEISLPEGSTEPDRNKWNLLENAVSNLLGYDEDGMEREKLDWEEAINVAHSQVSEDSEDDAKFMT